MKQTERLTLYGLVKYPELNDKQLSKKLNLKHSTVSSIRNRLRKNGYFRTIVLPSLENMGCELLAVIYTTFSPLIPLGERVKIAEKSIDIFEEIFFSLGEQDKGFSISLSKDYTTIGRINDIRTQTFGDHGLLEEDYPNIIVFPFEISKIYRFFDFAPLLKSGCNVDNIPKEKSHNIAFKTINNISFRKLEKNVYHMIVKYPELSDAEIGENIGVSRHTISRLRRKFEGKNLIRKINLPDIKKMGFEIFSLYHIKFNPGNPPDLHNDEACNIMSDSTVFMASRKFEAILLSV
ncbi:MAG: MarR family transcriptional regulator, partial [Candidatus Thermoplasmatota archaeon]|nr:MarR family transcriptional regulator [Candidatus Thermoplasmatota archaeon]